MQLDIWVTRRQPWYMARKDIVPVPKSQVPDHYPPPDPSGFPYPYGYPPVPMVDRPEWLELRPPHNPDNKFERGFVRTMLPLRAVLIGILWLTGNAYRFVFVSGTFTLIILLIIARN